MATQRPLVHDWREWRRLRAWELAELGWGVRRIALALAASPAAVSRWLTTARRDGPAALRACPHPGAPAKLSDDQKRLIGDCLWHGPEAYGFRGEVWTCPRVAQGLHEEFGVRYSRSHVARILKTLGWTPQVPITRAIQRDEAAIAHWAEQDWPLLKCRAQQEGRTLVFVDESGFYRLPGKVRTDSPRGRRPVVPEWQTQDQLSVMGAVTLPGRIYTLVRQEPLSGLDTVAFLEHLGREIGGAVQIVWARSPIHRRAAVSEYVAAVGAEGLALEALPAYAPDLNPVEWLWHHLKDVEMRNLVCLDLEELHEELHLALGRIRQTPRLIPTVFAAAGLVL